MAWWTRSPAGGAIRLLTAVGLVWVVADLLPRLVASIAPEVARPVRRTAAATLAPLRPLLRLAAWADARARARLPAARGARPVRLSGRCCGVFALAETIVVEVMTPRIDIIAVDVDGAGPGDPHPAELGARPAHRV